MQIDTAGTYTLKYTAEDACGNVTEVEREVVAEQISYSTVLFADGTFIINEKSTDRARNIALHGAVTSEYEPFVPPNGYRFFYANDVLWRTKKAAVKKVEFGSVIKPQFTDYWFYQFTNCDEFDFTNCDWTDIKTMTHMLQGTAPGEDFVFDCGNGQPTDISSCFRGMRLWRTDHWAGVKTIQVIMDTTKVTNMNELFQGGYELRTIDISSFDTPVLQNTNSMFRDCGRATTIFASDEFDVSNVTDSLSMFYNMSGSLVGGAGTAWQSTNPTDKTYAHIDGGTSNPGYFTLKSA